MVRDESQGFFNEIEQLQFIEERTQILIPLVEEVLPPRELGYYLQKVAKKVNKPVEQLIDEEKGEALGYQSDDNIKKENIAKHLAESEIPDEDFPEFLELSAYLADELLPPDQEKSSADLLRAVKMARSVEEIKLLYQFTLSWKHKFLGQGDDSSLVMTALNERLYLISGLDRKEIPTPLLVTEDLELEQELLQGFIEIQEFLTSAKPFYPPNQRDLIRGEFEWITRNFKSLDQIRKTLDALKALTNSQNGTNLKSLTDIVLAYSKSHSLEESSVEGVTRNLVPLITNGDPQTDVLFEGFQAWGEKPNEFRIADFTMHSFISKVTPININELILVSREIPTTTISRYEINRQDGETLSNFEGLRGLIHKQEPFIHDVIVGMVEYYKTGNKSKLISAARRIGYNLLPEPWVDISLYNGLVRDKRDQQLVPAINVLERLAVNTKPIEHITPHTSDPILNHGLSLIQSSERGHHKDRLVDVLNYVNSTLITMNGQSQIGLEPNFVLALSWLEHQGFLLLKNLTFEDQVAAFKQTWFHTILKFHALTWSPSFDPQEFAEFIANLKTQNSDLAAYKLIFDREMGNIDNLRKIYKQKDRKDKGALWSGNIAHELISLHDPKPATTQVGKRLREDRLKRRVRTSYHPGD